MASIATATRTSGADTAALPARRRFTVEEYYRMAEAGILHPDERLELLEGEIIRMAAIGSRHAASVDFLNEWYVPRVAGRAIVRIQGPLRLSSNSVPEPDLMLLRYQPDRYAAALPGPEDVLLLVEVSHATLRYDRDKKLPLYAAAGIQEAWILNLERQRVLVYRQPQATGYAQVITVGRGGSLSPAAFPDLSLPVAQLLG